MHGQEGPSKASTSTDTMVTLEALTVQIQTNGYQTLFQSESISSLQVFELIKLPSGGIGTPIRALIRKTFMPFTNSRAVHLMDGRC
jgi:hypothetical protein